MFGKKKKIHSLQKMSNFWLSSLKKNHKIIKICLTIRNKCGKIQPDRKRTYQQSTRTQPIAKNEVKIKKRIVPEGGESHGSSAEGGGKEQTIEYQHWSYLLTKKAWMIFKHQATRNANRKQKQKKHLAVFMFLYKF